MIVKTVVFDESKKYIFSNPKLEAVPTLIFSHLDAL